LRKTAAKLKLVSPNPWSQISVF